MQIRTRRNQVLILILLFAAEVQTRRVIRAAPGIATTGEYMVVMTPETSHERFEAIAEKVQTVSLSSKIHKMEGPFAKMIVTRLSVDEAHKVSLKFLCLCLCVSLVVSVDTFVYVDWCKSMGVCYSCFQVYICPLYV